MKNAFGTSRFSSVTLIVLTTWLVSGSGQNARANAIVNGDFATGDLTGWTVSAIDASGNPVTPLIEVMDLGGVNSAVFSSGTFANGPFISTLQQTFTVANSEPVLSLDFSLPAQTADLTGTGLSSFSDTLIVSVQDGGSRELLLVIRAGALREALAGRNFHFFCNFSQHFLHY
jgi:hypothetical protein